MERPLSGGDELAKDRAVSEVGMEALLQSWVRLRPSMLPLVTRVSSSSARSSVDSFSSWIILQEQWAQGSWIHTILGWSPAFGTSRPWDLLTLRKGSLGAVTEPPISRNGSKTHQNPHQPRLRDVPVSLSLSFFLTEIFSVNQHCCHQRKNQALWIDAPEPFPWLKLNQDINFRAPNPPPHSDAISEPGSGGFGLCPLPDLLVDGIQLLLEHHGQGLGIRVPTRGEHIHGAEERLAVIFIHIGDLRVTVKGVNAACLGLLPVLGEQDPLVPHGTSMSPNAKLEDPNQRSTTVQPRGETNLVITCQVKEIAPCLPIREMWDQCAGRPQF